MSTYQKKDGDISVFTNQSDNANAPSWKGNLLLNGVEYQVALWRKQGAKGEFLAGNVQVNRSHRRTAQSITLASRSRNRTINNLYLMAATFPSDAGLKLSLQIDGKRISIESDDSELTATELVELFYDLAIAATYMDNSVIDAMREVADEHDRRGRNMT